MDSEILVALATYNERENLPSLVEAIRQALSEAASGAGADVLVVDDNSPDGTGQWCEEFARQHPWFDCIGREGKQGLGTATALAMQTAVDRGYRHLVMMDADWSHHPEHLPAMIAAAGEADVAVGSRYCPDGGVEGWPWHRRIVSRMLNTVSCRLLRLPVRDASGSFRVYSVDRLRKLPLGELQSSGYAFLEEVLWLLRRSGATMAEVPITFRDRQAGRSKAGVRELFGKLAILARLALRR